MCLSIAIDRPDDVLATGEHKGFEWAVIHNRMGYRCGYVRVDPGHPWYGKGYYDVDARVHGGLTFAEHDKPCDKGGADDGYWFGFDCGHGGDAPDPKLQSPESAAAFRTYLRVLNYGVVRSQEYAEAECRSLCEQAKKARGAA